MRKLHWNIGVLVGLAVILAHIPAIADNGKEDTPSAVASVSQEEIAKLPAIRDISVYLNGVKPLDEYGDAFDMGFGVGVRGRVSASDRVRFTTDFSMNMIGGANDFPDQDYSQITSELLERVEILAAPQSTLYGNASGGLSIFGGAGVVNVIDKQTFGDDDFKYYRTDALYEFGVRYDLPVGTGALSLEGSYNGTIADESDNWFEGSLSYARNIGRMWTDAYRRPSDAWGGSGFTFGGGAGCGYQVGDFGNAVGNSLYFSGKANYILNDRFRPFVGGSFEMFSNQGNTDSEYGTDLTVYSFDAGVEMDFRPIVKSSDTYLSLAVTPKILKYDFSSPAFESSDSETKIDFTVGGGWRAPVSERVTLDFFAGIPVLGGILREDEYVQQMRTQLLVLITPNVIRSVDDF